MTPRCARSSSASPAPTIPTAPNLPLRVLFDEGAGDQIRLPEAVREAWGGDLRLPATCLYANFVESIDGVVAISGMANSGSVISAHDPADRLGMAVLRAVAGAVLIGAGTLRDSPGHHWTARHVHPELASRWAELRAGLGLEADPRLVVLTISGELEVAHPAIQGGATILTTEAGAERLQPIIPASCELKAWAAAAVPLGQAVSWLRERGHHRVLSEAGPRVTGQLLAAGLLDELFVTVAPVLAGREAGSARLGLVEGRALLPGDDRRLRLTATRQGGDTLLLRYGVR